MSEVNKIVNGNVASELPSFSLLDFNLVGNLEIKRGANCGISNSVLEVQCRT